MMCWNEFILHAALAVTPPAPATAAATGPEAAPGPWLNASTVASLVDRDFWGITILCAFFFVLIIGLMLWFMWKYRQVGREIRPGGLSHHTPLEVTWTIIPLIMVVVIFWIGADGYIKLRVAPQGSYEVNVVGQKWFWTLNYPNGASLVTGPYGAGDVLLFPEDQPVKLVMQSQDVIHSFFIPEFRVKQDVVPGRVSTLWFEPTEPGMYNLFCAEYCGKGHSEMLGKVQVLPRDKFDAEMARLKDWIRVIPDEELWWKAGPKLYNRCAACHTVDGKDSTGPTFKGLFKKLVEEGEKFTDGTNLKDLIAKGVFASEEDYIQRSMWFPQEKVVVNRQSSMPTFKGSLDDKARRALLDYLKHLSDEPDNFDKDGKIKAPRLAELESAAAGKPAGSEAPK